MIMSVRSRIDGLVITVEDSPTDETKRKRPHDEDDVGSPKRPLLESVKHRFRVNQQERLQKIEDIKSHRQQELSHSAFIKQNIADPEELRKASFAVSSWTAKNALNTKKHVGNVPWLDVAQRNAAKDRTQTSTSGSKTSAGHSQNASSEGNQDPLQTTSDQAEESVIIVEPTGHSQCNPLMKLTGTVPRGNDTVESLSDDSVIIIEPTESSEHEKLTCPILNCAAEFSTDSRLKHHMNEFKHSPCNPCLKIVDCSCNPDPLCYICPSCKTEYQSQELCRQHMLLEKHLSFLPPYAVKAYLCPQCLCLFNNYGTCWQHIEGSSHIHMASSFKEYSFGPGCHPEPIPICEELVEDYIRKCEKTKFRVQCLECSMEPTTPASLRKHMEETNNCHLISSLTEFGPVDVFSKYLAPFCCGHCQRLITTEQQINTPHICASGVSGIVIRNRNRNFKDFVIQCGLTLIKSLPTVPTTTNPKSQAVPTRSSGEGREPVPMQSDRNHLAVPGTSRSRWRSGDERQSRLEESKNTVPHPSRSRSGDRSPNPNCHSVVDTENLSQMRHIIFLDLDNWHSFFSKLPQCLPEKTFVWAFHGGLSTWTEPRRVFVFEQIKRAGCFYLHDKCGRTKDATDFALVLTVGKMDAILPKHIPFTIVSGDKGFVEVEKQMEKSGRRSVVVDPHNAQRFADSMIYMMVTSVADT